VPAVLIGPVEPRWDASCSARATPNATRAAARHDGTLDDKSGSLGSSGREHHFEGVMRGASAGRREGGTATAPECDAYCSATRARNATQQGSLPF